MTHGIETAEETATEITNMNKIKASFYSIAVVSNNNDRFFLTWEMKRLQSLYSSKAHKRQAISKTLGTKIFKFLIFVFKMVN